jgi:predicted protein tyrosine phosphatase
MFDLKITNLPDAVTMASEWATHTISILDPELYKYPDIFELPKARHGAIIRRFYFHDVEKYESVLFEFKQLVSKEQLEEVLAFTARLQDDDKLLVHCHAGISRSTAVASAILCQHGLNPVDAVKEIYQQRPLAIPNMLVVRLMDDLLNLDNELIVAHENYHDK